MSWLQICIRLIRSTHLTNSPRKSSTTWAVSSSSNYVKSLPRRNARPVLSIGQREFCIASADNAHCRLKSKDGPPSDAAGAVARSSQVDPRLPFLEGNIMGVVSVLLTSTGALGSKPVSGYCSANRPKSGVEVVGQCEGNRMLCEGDVSGGSISVRNVACAQRTTAMCVNACEVSVLFTTPVAYKGIVISCKRNLLKNNK